MRPIAEVPAEAMPNPAPRWMHPPAGSVSLVGARTVRAVEGDVPGLEKVLSGAEMVQVDEAHACY